MQNWGSAKKIFSVQPIDKVRDYLGEEVAMYFAWLGFYTQYLLVASVPGIIAFLIRYPVLNPNTNRLELSTKKLPTINPV